jgi:hypothetical protein
MFGGHDAKPHRMLFVISQFGTVASQYAYNNFAPE